MNFVRLFFMCLALFSIDVPASPADQSSSENAQRSYFLVSEESYTESYFLLPLANYFLPGVGQWVTGQDEKWLYSGIALAGALYSGRFSDDVETAGLNESRLSDAEKKNYNLHDESKRKVDYGGQLWLAMGSMSAYHTFRTHVSNNRRQGKFRFLTREETPAEIFAAPFRFEYLKRPSTSIPLGIISGLYLLTLVSDFDEESEIKLDPLTTSDVFYAGGISFNAGTHEEAAFRGWIMPVIMEWTGSSFWSNTLTAVIFGAAHLSTVPVPWIQTLLGWHFGNVTINNQWTVSEATFIHVWWDVFALLRTYQTKYRDPKAALPVIWLPALKWNF